MRRPVEDAVVALIVAAGFIAWTSYRQHAAFRGTKPSVQTWTLPLERSPERAVTQPNRTRSA